MQAAIRLGERASVSSTSSTRAGGHRLAGIRVSSLVDAYARSEAMALAYSQERKSAQCCSGGHRSPILGNSTTSCVCTMKGSICLGPASVATTKQVPSHGGSCFPFEIDRVDNVASIALLLLVVDDTGQLAKGRHQGWNQRQRKQWWAPRLLVVRKGKLQTNGPIFLDSFGTLEYALRALLPIYRRDTAIGGLSAGVFNQLSAVPFTGVGIVVLFNTFGTGNVR
ncbi:uncharacterized protein BCR38DRAFT_470690 [Pseudomassariella vexata]|uniref:Uncharacterized protein n=1 Tax=Pseudomassariella vexata TaxID=1141098 RepID=A0A1Y2EJU4_9PEZI|nr:uncharacterized protein BCR38DRAFT_470690 [Pseudomassariella vexata]ORY71820.1 hypothetical protein BCR38DRAFT_470690 [Pseudomassariella vexata]